jgi:hypothetical protein
MSSSPPRRVTALRGQVTRDLYGQGSKSEREAVFIDTADGRYVLRRKTGSVFDDPELMPYVGHLVECDGFLLGTTLLAERIAVVE